MSEWIDLAAVEPALNELRGGDSHGSVRATTLNLVIRCATADQASDAEEVLDGIGGSRPLRAFVVMPATGTPKARVASACWQGGGHEVCTERIQLKGQRAALPSSVVSLLVADLPVFVWWQGEVPPAGDGVLAEIVDMATRFILDSDQSGLEAVARIDALAAGLVDLAWVRTAPWREAMASLFDGRAQRRALGRLIGVEVSGPPNQAALIAGWLRSRLGRQVGLDVRSSKRLSRVALVCGDELFTVARTGRNQHGTASGPGLPERTVALPTLPLVALLAAELDRLGAEHTFEQALAAARAA